VLSDVKILEVLPAHMDAGAVGLLLEKPDQPVFWSTSVDKEGNAGWVRQIGSGPATIGLITLKYKPGSVCLVLSAFLADMLFRLPGCRVGTSPTIYLAFAEPIVKGDIAALTFGIGVRGDYPDDKLR